MKASAEAAESAKAKSAEVDRRIQKATERGDSLTRGEGEHPIERAADELNQQSPQLRLTRAREERETVRTRVTEWERKLQDATEAERIASTAADEFERKQGEPIRALRHQVDDARTALKTAQDNWAQAAPARGQLQALEVERALLWNSIAEQMPGADPGDDFGGLARANAPGTRFNTERIAGLEKEIDRLKAENRTFAQLDRDNTLPAKERVTFEANKKTVESLERQLTAAKNAARVEVLQYLVGIGKIDKELDSLDPGRKVRDLPNPETLRARLAEMEQRLTQLTDTRKALEAKEDAAKKALEAAQKAFDDNMKMNAAHDVRIDDLQALVDERKAIDVFNAAKDEEKAANEALGRAAAEAAELVPRLRTDLSLADLRPRLEAEQKRVATKQRAAYQAEVKSAAPDRRPMIKELYQGRYRTAMAKWRDAEIQKLDAAKASLLRFECLPGVGDLIEEIESARAFLLKQTASTELGDFLPTDDAPDFDRPTDEVPGLVRGFGTATPPSTPPVTPGATARGAWAGLWSTSFGDLRLSPINDVDARQSALRVTGSDLLPCNPVSMCEYYVGEFSWEKPAWAPIGMWSPNGMLIAGRPIAARASDGLSGSWMVRGGVRGQFSVDGSPDKSFLGSMNVTGGGSRGTSNWSGQRRRFSVEYWLRILKLADACKKPGDVGALLRREGLYSSRLITRRHRRARVPSPGRADPRLPRRLGGRDGSGRLSRSHPARLSTDGRSGPGSRGHSRAVAMKMTGYKTRSVFDRYDITSGSDLKDAAKRLDARRGQFGDNSPKSATVRAIDQSA